MAKMYAFLFSMFLINVSYRCNRQASISLGQASIFPLRSLLNLDLMPIFESMPAVFYVLWNIASQSVLASGYLFVHSWPSFPVLQGILALSFIVPSFTVMLPLAYNPVPMWGLGLLITHAVIVICFKSPKVICLPLQNQTFIRYCICSVDFDVKLESSHNFEIPPAFFFYLFNIS